MHQLAVQLIVDCIHAIHWLAQMPAIDVLRVGEGVLAGILATDEFLAQPFKCFGAAGAGRRPICAWIGRRPQIAVRFYLRLHMEGVPTKLVGARIIVGLSAHFFLLIAGFASRSRSASVVGWAPVCANAQVGIQNRTPIEAESPLGPEAPHNRPSGKLRLAHGRSVRYVVLERADVFGERGTVPSDRVDHLCGLYKLRAEGGHYGSLRYRKSRRRTGHRKCIVYESRSCRDAERQFAQLLWQ